MTYTTIAAILTTLISVITSLILISSPEEKIQFLEYFMRSVPLSWLYDMPAALQFAHKISNFLFYTALSFVMLTALRIHWVAGLVAAVSALVVVKLDITFHEQFLPMIIKDVLLQTPHDTAIISQVLSFSIVGLPMVLRGAALDVMQIYTRRT